MEPTQTETRYPIEWFTVHSAQGERGRVCSCVCSWLQKEHFQLNIIFHSTNEPCLPSLKEEPWEERNARLSYPPAISCYSSSFMMTWRDMGAYRTPPSWIIDNWEIYLPSDKALLLLWQVTKAITSCRKTICWSLCVCVCCGLTYQIPSVISHI